MSADLPRKRIIGYADKLSLAPGETIAFKASCEDIAQYRADIVRLVCADLHPQGRGWIEEEIATPVSGSYPGREQAIPVGSWALVESALGLCSQSLTVALQLWPTTPHKGEQALLARMDIAGSRGWMLLIDDAGAIALRIATAEGVTTVSTGVAVQERVWSFVGASFDAASGAIRVWQRPQKTWPGHDATGDGEGSARGTLDTAGLSLGIAARPGRVEGPRRFCLDPCNGKLEAPRLYGRAMEAGEALALQETAARERSLIAAWDFARDTMGERVRDTGPSAHDGCLINVPTRAMTGHNWDGSVMDWKAAPQQYGAIHFHDDDIADSGWETDFALTVPQGLKSGIYAARLVAGEQSDHIPFVVRAPRGTATADALFLMPSASYLAYANEHGAIESAGAMDAFSGHLSGLSAQDLLLGERPDLGYSLYCHHGDGSGVAVSSRLRPVLNMRPGVTNAWVGPAGTFPWQFNADLPLVDFLEHEGFAFDVATDEDLHDEGLDLLSRYRVVLTGSHPEYYSKPMLDALDGWLQRGGRLMYLGGNGFYWRVAFHPEIKGVMELRRGEDGIRDWVSQGGEYYQAFDGAYGGMWERQGRPIHALAGVGMAGQGFDISGFYRRTAASRDPRAAFVFEGIEDEIIGDFGTVGGGAAGIEVDRCDFAKGSPPNTLVLASSEGLSDLYYPGPEEIDNARPFMDGSQNPNLRADMTFHETAGGGAVFSTGSIAWIGSLSWNGFDNNVAGVTANVLRRFLDPEPFQGIGKTTT